jgi:thiosulfate dehydrogenase [quinone] large subunit
MKNEFVFFKTLSYFNRQLSLLVILRVVIGWHIFYEGFAKWINPDWSSVGYLLDSKGGFAFFFKWIASDPTLLNLADTLNVWGLLIIGFCLMTGLFEKWVTIGAIALIGLYYLSHPPLIGYKFDAPGEGSYLLVNKNLIEIFAVSINLVYPNSRLIGLDRLIYQMRHKK